MKDGIYFEKSMEDKSLMTETKEELKQQLGVLTARRDRMQKNLYEVEKEITVVNKKLAMLKK
ncbi:hypothetical protein [Bacillus sp. cl95]|uniref:hypothetical protein n=1 Tax=Bacillus sp. cl95 TaxID=1761761 RepID=UPI001113C412|nr:hypothetical protein [Bacillus sp. cl95]